jgi:hypothetical protein
LLLRSYTKVVHKKFESNDEREIKMKINKAIGFMAAATLLYVVIAGAGLTSNVFNHHDYKTVSSTEVTVITNDMAPVYVPKGMIVEGKAYEYTVTDDGTVLKGKIIEGSTDREYLVKTSEKATIRPAN